MTTSTQGFTATGLGATGLPGQQGATGLGFPAPIGAEQMFGYPQQTYGYAQQGLQYQAQLAAQQLAGHVLQLMQQIVIPQVAALAAQQVQLHIQQQVQQQIPQLVAQLTMSQLTGQPYPFTGQPYPFTGQQWGQPQWGQQPQGWLPFGSPGRAYQVPA